jgi:hypothetical protein
MVTALYVQLVAMRPGPVVSPALSVALVHPQAPQHAPLALPAHTAVAVVLHPILRANPVLRALSMTRLVNLEAVAYCARWEQLPQ